MATPEFARGLRALATEYGALLVLDEIRTNFRVGPSVRGHWASLGEAPDGLDVAPDMSCICKAVANGHPLAALVGGARAREGASIITASGTFWLSGGPMAAALATLDVLEADGSAAMAHMQTMGRLLTDGIQEQAARHEVPITVSGPDAMPFVTFDADDATPAERPRGASNLLFCTSLYGPYLPIEVNVLFRQATFGARRWLKEDHGYTHTTTGTFASVTLLRTSRTRSKPLNLPLQNLS